MFEVTSAWLLTTSSGLIYVILLGAYLDRFSQRRDSVLNIIQVNKAKEIYRKVYPLCVKNKMAELRISSYVCPIALSVVTASGFIVVALTFCGLDMGFPESFKTKLGLVNREVLGGFLGGYIWGLYDCITRFRARNWTPNSQYFIWFRLVLGPALGGIAAHPFKDDYSSLAAFGLGAFPTDTLQKWITLYTARILRLEKNSETSLRPAWTSIQGLPPLMLERLLEVEVLSPCHLAYSDPMVLFTQTNIEWKMILDLIDQALLAVYIEERTEKLRPLGIRGAIEMAVLGDRMENDKDKKAASETVKEVANVLGGSASTVMHLIQNLVEDPQVELIWELWYREERGAKLS